VLSHDPGGSSRAADRGSRAGSGRRSGASALLVGLIAVQNATSIWAVIGYAIYATVLRLSIDQLVEPLVLGKAAYLHPTLVIFCHLAGGYLFGIVGLVRSGAFSGP
jgi:predicted PurR-regulated permease PerM